MNDLNGIHSQVKRMSIECNGSRDRYYNSWWILGDARLRADRRLAQYSVRQFAPTAAASWFSLG
ncbi:unnamed protein product [Trichogramma brassicae]|uniref:Uncharacterized protein n=1 Tax=Trichogramma brassicae TaxID=86971 RepID=A0A6H5J0A3_9HYME|nr:unnamed protein product [Trichogramma brassicae]